MLTTIEQMTDELLQHGLLNDDSLGQACHSLEKKGDALTGANLLSLLVAEGMLTPYQAEEVAAGRAEQLYLGNYQILSRIGEGGMGTVYKALHRRMRRIVAVKVLRKDIATPDFIARFRREIQLLARLNHPNVVIAYDSDQCPVGDYLVMEYVEGVDLSEILKRSGPLSVAESISAIRQAALALGYAHQQGIVHRDIKPANLLRDVSGCVKVVDLGLARLSAWEGAKGSDLTQLGAVAGTVDYMSPEQADNPLAVDSRSDIYSLGCTLFSLLTGGPVFSKTSLIARILAHRQEAPPKLTIVRDDVPIELNAIFQRMVAKAPGDRFTSMEEIVAAIDAINATTSVGEIPSTASDLPSKGPRPPARHTVMVVEESRLQVGMIRKMLSEIGMTSIHNFPTGEEALDRVSTVTPTIVLSSMKLPDMSGLELAARIRDSKRWLDAGIILMSVDQWTADHQSAARRMGRVQLLNKPFSAEDLMTSIKLASPDGAREVVPLEGLHELKVLIVDDSNVARRQEQKVLSQLGFKHFTHADDGDTAIQQLQTTRFDLIVTDYHMPNIDGRQLITHIRQESSQADVPIIMVTTEFDPRKLAVIYQLGVSAICNKSFDPELVRNVVMQLFA